MLEVLSTEVWPCNFFSASTTMATLITCPSFTAARTRLPAPIIAAACRRFQEESPWGTTSYASFAQGWRNVFHFFMPNVYAFRNPSPEPECGSEDRMQWDVPLDDQRSLEFRLRRLPLERRSRRINIARAGIAAAAEPKFPSRKWARRCYPGKLSFKTWIISSKTRFRSCIPRTTSPKSDRAPSRLARKNISAAPISASSCSVRFGNESSRLSRRTAA